MSQSNPFSRKHLFRQSLLVKEGHPEKGPGKVREFTDAEKSIFLTNMVASLFQHDLNPKFISGFSPVISDSAYHFI